MTSASKMNGGCLGKSVFRQLAVIGRKFTAARVVAG